MAGSTTELIKGKLDIVDFLRGYLTLTPAGRNFKALCPFHHEKTPSFMVSPDRQTWHCFGCGLGGDVFTFIMKYENLEFTEAMRMLAEKAGVELRHENPAEYRYSGLLYDLNDQAKNYYRKMLAAAPVAKKYLDERGLSAETIDTFEIGWAPNEPEGLSMYLLNNGTAPQDLIQAGLSIKTERGLMLDRFRGRIMFPIHNHVGKVVGFTGRILPQLDKGDMGKYINSPETPIFQKSKLLYGFWKSKDAIREAKVAVLMEGQMDFLMSYQSGVKNVIASSGTALTADHLHVVHRLAEEIVLCFDSDIAGADAAERAIDLAEAGDFTVKIATFKEFKDAADAAKANPENVAKTIAAAVPAPEFYFAKYLPNDNNELKTRDGLHKLRAVLAKLKNLASPVERSFWLAELSNRTAIDERVLREESAKANPSGIPAAKRSGEQDEEIAKRHVSRQDRLCEQLLVAAFAKNDFSLAEDCLPYFKPAQKEVFRLLKSGKKKSEDPSLDQAIDLVILGGSSELTDDEIAALKAELAKEYYKERRQILATAIKNAEAKGNDAELKAALEELKNLPAISE
ncbi:MAG TPA: DNA primase [Candidatus Paceibacterota bacterium]|nr:DNA primase [Candidatus Paceibacterota bacterium]